MTGAADIAIEEAKCATIAPDGTNHTAAIMWLWKQTENGYRLLFDKTDPLY
jgi:hypothetical protein